MKTKKELKIYDAKRYKANKEKRDAQIKANYKSHEPPYYVIYLLPKNGYVGVTKNPKKRIRNHKALGRDITDWRVLHRIEDREMAYRQEDFYHNIGFEGGSGRRNIIKIKNDYYQVKVKDGDYNLYAHVKSMEDAYECRKQFYNKDLNLWGINGVDRLSNK